MPDTNSTAPSARIVGVGLFLPDRVVTNEELAPKIDSTPEWIEQRIGIKSRHWVEPGQSNSDMGAKAAQAALRDAGLATSDVDAIIYATLSPDAGFPGSGVFMQEHLGITDIPALDVRNQCSGFLYGLSIAKAWIQSGMYRTVLLVGSEIHSTGLDVSPEGRSVTAMFGDGAGAVVVQASSTPGVLDIELGADGSGAHSLWAELPSSTLAPVFSASHLDGRQYPQMKGRAVMKRAVETLGDMLSSMLERNGLAPEEIIYVPHQSNINICKLVASRAKIPLDNVVSTIEEHGNITAASIPCALRVAMDKGLVKAGDTILMGAFGSGYTWGGALVKL